MVQLNKKKLPTSPLLFINYQKKLGTIVPSFLYVLKSYHIIGRKLSILTKIHVRNRLSSVHDKRV
ncbi:MAG: hypothetical protein U0L63_05810, partial [Streptococcus equinus]|nr:hypothetical protein [Streptococcus equinus]